MSLLIYSVFVPGLSLVFSRYEHEPSDDIMLTGCSVYIQCEPSWSAKWPWKSRLCSVHFSMCTFQLLIDIARNGLKVGHRLKLNSAEILLLGCYCSCVAVSQQRRASRPVLSGCASQSSVVWSCWLNAETLLAGCADAHRADAVVWMSALHWPSSCGWAVSRIWLLWAHGDESVVTEQFL